MISDAIFYKSAFLLTPNPPPGRPDHLRAHHTSSKCVKFPLPKEEPTVPDCLSTQVIVRHPLTHDLLEPVALCLCDVPRGPSEHLQAENIRSMVPSPLTHVEFISLWIIARQQEFMIR